jgi:hypothetical protein
LIWINARPTRRNPSKKAAKRKEMLIFYAFFALQNAGGNVGMRHDVAGVKLSRYESEIDLNGCNCEEQKIER